MVSRSLNTHILVGLCLALLMVGVSSSEEGVMKHTMKILYCASWGMKRNFVNVARFLQQKFPDLIIEGGTYPAPPIMQFAGNVLAFVQLAFLASMLMGADALCRMIGLRQRPAWTYSIEQNAMQYGILVFIILPQVLSQFSSSGAFELILDNDTPIFSKLNAGRFPTQEELINGLQAAGLKLAS